MDKGEAFLFFISIRITEFVDIRFRLFILIETVEMASSTDPGQDLTAMSSAPESCIYIDAVRADVKAINAFFQKNRYMIWS
jgi:hypothetical protein